MSEILPEELLKRANNLCRKAKEKSLSLTCAESCTGGLLSSILTDIEGLSHVFERGFVVYSNAAKSDLLGLEPALVDSCDAVSREVAQAMARGALQRSQADIAVAITGFAGPAGDGNEEGLVHLACARRGGRLTHREEHFGARGRDEVRWKSIEVAIEMMAETMDG